MALWQQAFTKPTTMAQELTRQRIIQEDRCGRRAAQAPIPGREYREIMRGQASHAPADPWAPSSRRPRESLPAPICGYGGAIPRVRKEHVGRLQSEASSSYVPHISNNQPSSALAQVRRMAPGGGSSALGTAPNPVPGHRTITNMTIYGALNEARSLS